MNTLLSQAADLRAQAHTLAEQALFGDLFASTSTETIAQLNAQADELEAQAAVAPAPAPAVELAEKISQEFKQVTACPTRTGGVKISLDSAHEYTAHSLCSWLEESGVQITSDDIDPLAGLRAIVVEPAHEPSPAEQLDNIFNGLFS